MRRDHDIVRLVEADRHRLGALRFSPLRLWFGLLVRRLADLEGVAVQVGSDGQCSRIDLTRPLPEPPAFTGLDDRAWLTQLLDDVRRQLADQERTSPHERPLHECWVGRGTMRAWGLGLFGRRCLRLRFVNAADAGDQILVEHRWWSGPCLGIDRTAASAIVRTSDPARIGERVSALIRGRTQPVGAARWFLDEVSGLVALDRGLGATPERLVGLIHLSHGTVRAAEADALRYGRRLPRRLPASSRRVWAERRRQTGVVGWRPGGHHPAPARDVSR